MSEITIVTAFFDIGRKNFSAVPRTNEKYFNDFMFWARLNNRLIIYTDAASADKIFEIRKSFQREKQTHIIVIDDIYRIAPEIYENMKRVTREDLFIDFRFLPYATSNIPQYS